MLSEKAFQEADRVYNILTRDLGLIRASAIGVRKESSKLRGALEPFSLSLVSLVRGKEYWRITSAQILKPIGVTPSLAKPFSLLEKLVQGEEAHPELFDTIESAISSTDFNETFEINLVAQILHKLGYLREEDLGLEKKELIKAINDGLQVSQLT